MSSYLSPGVHFILTSVPHLLLAPVLSHLFLIFFRLDLSLPKRGLLYVLSIPALSFLQSIKYSFTRKRLLKEYNAQEVPLWVGKWPGNLDVLFTLYNGWKNGYPGDGVDDTFEKLGMTFRTRLFGIDQIWTMDPKFIKLILATDFEGYEKGDRFNASSGSVLGSGIFNADGEMWKFHRGITRPYFTKDRITDFEMFQRYADDAINQARQRLEDGYAIDFQDLVSRYTLDTGTSFLFGSSVDSLSSRLPYPQGREPKNLPSTSRHPAEVFAEAFSHAQHTISERGYSGTNWPLNEILGDKTVSDVRTIYEFIDPIVKKALARKSGNNANSKNGIDDEEPDTLLSHLVHETDDMQLLRDETLNILIAARDTTSSLLTFVVYLLTKHPEVLQRLRSEINEKVGMSRPPTPENIKDMSYMRAVLNETLRLFPPVPINVRQTTRTTTIKSEDPDQKPFLLSPKTSVVYSVWAMHRSKKFWGPDALKFDPDRFIDSRVQKYLVPNPFIFLPFNAGPRICLGQQFAYNQASFFLTRLLQSFDDFRIFLHAQPEWSYTPEEWSDQKYEGTRKWEENIWPKTHLTMYSYGGLWLQMKAATE